MQIERNRRVVRPEIGSFRWRTGTRNIVATLALLLLGCCWWQPAEAQLSGSIQIGQSSSTITSGDGQVDSRSRLGTLSARFGTGPGSGFNQQDPYGRLNYGRAGGFFFGDGFVNGNPRSTWSGLIDQNFEIMRRTSPFPQRFLGGIYNPRPFSHRFGSSFSFSYPAFGDFYYGGYAFGAGPGIYGGYVPSVYSTYGSWYPPYLPQDRVYIIEPVIVNERPATESQKPERLETSENDKPAPADAGDYYLSPRSSETLDEAVSEIRRAWMNGDYARLKTRIPGNGKVRIYLKGKYKYSVDAADFGQMTRDAMGRIDTISFTLDKVEKKSDDRAFASGKHAYYDPDRQKHEVYVSYGLTREDGKWKITEAGSSTEPIATQSD